MRSLLLACLVATLAAAEDGYLAVFTDELAKLATPLPDGPVACRVRILDRAGWSGPVALVGSVAAGVLTLAPLREGIHVVDAGDGVDRRFLAMAPPPPLDPAAVRRALPRRGARLLAGEPFRIVAFGDSVTHTGRYDRLLQRLLERATGDRAIVAESRSYPGRSVDAAVRFFAGDTRDGVDLGLLMYGLNDQQCGVPLAAFREQYAWIARHLAEDRGADCVFLQPTPHGDLGAVDAEGAAYVARTIGFATALRPLGAQLGVPVAETFAAVWGDGGDGLRASVAALKPLYPRSFSQQLTSALEGDGDLIHANALGHLAIARAVLAAIAGETPVPTPLALSATTRWTADGAVTELTARNLGAEPRRGRIELHAPLWAEIAPDGDLAYDLAPGASLVAILRWPRVATPSDLLRWPNDQYLAAEEPWLMAADVVAGRCRVAAVPAPFAPAAALDRSRRVVERAVVEVPVRWRGGERALRVEAPAAADVARVPIVERVALDDGVAWAVGEAVFTRFAGALAGEIACDGALDEWRDAVWSPLGEPCQARGWGRAEDHRATPDEGPRAWSARAGATALHLAVRCGGDVAQDGCLIFVDPRPSAELGSAGRYYWVSANLRADGSVALEQGETTSASPAFAGRWARRGDETTLELSLPYATWDGDVFPADGDLGIALVWTHRGGDGARTILQWGDEGHPWNPRCWGVLRLQAQPARDALPFVVRVH